MDDRRRRVQVISAGVLSLLLTLGVARFSYTPLIPLMQDQAGLGAAGAGWLAAVNYAGYLAGAVLVSSIREPGTRDRLYRLGMLVAVLSTLLMGVTTDEAGWAASRFLAGLSSAAGMLLGTGLVLNWLIRHGHRSELGIHFSGVGLSIAGCAALVELTSRWADWREQWFAFTVIGVVLLVPALRWMPPADATGTTTAGRRLEDRPPGALLLALFMAAYACAGVGYVVSATFVVAVVEQLPGLSGRGNLAFLVIGLAAAPAALLWDRVARRTGDLDALVLASVLQVVGIVLPVLVGGLVATLLGALLFGGTFVGLVSLVLAMAGRYHPSRPAAMMGKMTVSYGTAQIAGPAAAAALASRSGGYDSGLYLAGAVMLLGACLFLAMKVVEQRYDTTAADGTAGGTRGRGRWRRP